MYKDGAGKTARQLRTGQNLHHAVWTLSLQMWELKKPLFFIKVACLWYFITPMQNELTQNYFATPKRPKVQQKHEGHSPLNSQSLGKVFFKDASENTRALILVLYLGKFFKSLINLELVL